MRRRALAPHFRRVRASTLAVALLTFTGCQSYFLTDGIGDAGSASDASRGDAAVDGGVTRPARIYVYGGSLDDNKINEDGVSLFAEIADDGMLGPWKPAAQALAPITWHCAALSNEGFFVLLTGIVPPDGGNRKIFVGAIDGNNVTGFTKSADIFETRLQHATAVFNGSSLYVFGGEPGDAQPAEADVWRATVKASTFTTPVRVTPLPSPLSRMAIASNAEGVFLIGGTTDTSAPSAAALHATFNADGSISPFEAQVPLSSARTYPAAVAYGNNVYVTGGENSIQLNNVLSCPIGGSGKLGSCSETAPLPDTRLRHRALAHKGHLYVVGGRGTKDNLATFVGDIDTNGGVVNWRPTTPLPTPAIYGEALLLP